MTWCMRYTILYIHNPPPSAGAAPVSASSAQERSRGAAARQGRVRRQVRALLHAAPHVQADPGAGDKTSVYTTILMIYVHHI